MIRKGPSSVIYPSFIAFFIGLVIVEFYAKPVDLWLSAVFIGVGYGSLFPCTMQTIAIQGCVKSNEWGMQFQHFLLYWTLDWQ